MSEKLFCNPLTEVGCSGLGGLCAGNRRGISCGGLGLGVRCVGRFRFRVQVLDEIRDVARLGFELVSQMQESCCF